MVNSSGNYVLQQKGETWAKGVVQGGKRIGNKVLVPEQGG